MDIVTIEMTRDEAQDLEVFLLMTTQYRLGEAQAWSKLAVEKEPDGTPTFQSAESNARFWTNMEATMKSVQDHIKKTLYPATWEYEHRKKEQEAQNDA